MATLGFRMNWQVQTVGSLYSKYILDLGVDHSLELYLHADDLRCVAPNLLPVEQQASIVKSFTDRNFLKLNMDKLEILEMTNGNHVRVDPIQVRPVVLKPSSSVTYPGIIWSNSLSPKEPASMLSSHLSLCSLKPLEDFQAEVGKKIFNLPKHHANVSVLVALALPTMCLCILNRKLSFLWKLMNPQYRSISSDIFNLLKDQDPGPLIVQQSRLLEQIYGTSLLLNGSLGHCV